MTATAHSTPLVALDEFPTLTTTGVRQGSYFVRTRAKNACGLSAVSNEVVITIR